MSISRTLLVLGIGLLMHGVAEATDARPILSNGDKSERDKQWPIVLGGYKNAWKTVPYSRVPIAVIDTGFGRHPDIAMDLSQAYDFTDDDSDVMTSGASAAHGVAVLGVLAANGKVVGVARAATVIPLRADSCRSAARAIDYAAGGSDPNRSALVRIISVSVGSSSDCAALSDAVANAGRKHVIVIAAVGNELRNLNERCDEFPACYSSRGLSNVVAVGASASDGNLWNDGTNGTNYGTCSVDIAAPGYHVWVPVAETGGYQVSHGTSLSAPHVAGVVALMLEVNPQLQPRDVKRILMTTADSGENTRRYVAAGILNPEKAVRAAKDWRRE